MTACWNASLCVLCCVLCVWCVCVCVCVCVCCDVCRLHVCACVYFVCVCRVCCVCYVCGVCVLCVCISSFHSAQGTKSSSAFETTNDFPRDAAGATFCTAFPRPFTDFSSTCLVDRSLPFLDLWLPFVDLWLPFVIFHCLSLTVPLAFRAVHCLSSTFR